MTNKNIEELFKQSLEGHELPYDASAWNALNNKLNKSNASGYFKLWPWVLGSVLLITVSSILFWNTDKKSTITNESDKTNTSKNKTNTEKNPSQTINLADQKQKQPLKDVLPNVVQEELPNSSEDNNNNEEKNTLEDSQSEDRSVENAQESTKNQDLVINEIPKIVCPALTFNCIGEQQDISNLNGVDIILISPSNRQIIIPANSHKLITASEKGYYRIGTLSSEELFTEISKQLVNEIPALDLSIEELNYLNGLPTLPINVRSSETNYTIYVNNKFMQQTNVQMAELYLFENGSNQIMISACNEFKCTSTVYKTISTDQDYNLLAVNAFDPFSSDNRKSTFMPYALTLRKSPFKLVIIDPSDGGIVFESSDASNAWDGYDKRNGKMVPPNKAYAWKVNIANPEQKEKRDYKGTIVRL